MVDKKTDEKEALELKKIYNHYIDERLVMMKNTSFKVEDVFGDVLSKDNFSQKQITELNNFSAKIMKVYIIKLVCLNLERRKISIFYLVLLLNITLVHKRQRHEVLAPNIIAILTI